MHGERKGEKCWGDTLEWVRGNEIQCVSSRTDLSHDMDTSLRVTGGDVEYMAHMQEGGERK